MKKTKNIKTMFKKALKIVFEWEFWKIRMRLIGITIESEFEFFKNKILKHLFKPALTNREHNSVSQK